MNIFIEKEKLKKLGSIEDEDVNKLFQEVQSKLPDFYILEEFTFLGKQYYLLYNRIPIKEEFELLLRLNWIGNKSLTKNEVIEYFNSIISTLKP